MASSTLLMSCQTGQLTYLTFPAQAYSTRRFVLCLTLCYFVLVFSLLLALRLPRLGKRELILVLFVRLFDLRLFVWFCLFPLPLGVWEGLRFVTVALPGLFSYLFSIL